MSLAYQILLVYCCYFLSSTIVLANINTAAPATPTTPATPVTAERNTNTNNNKDEACDVYKAKQYDYIKDELDTVYDTSFKLYKECTTQLDNYIELYDNEIQVNDIAMEKLEECESKNTNLSSSTNYTKQVKLLKNNVELESNIVALNKKIEALEEKNSVAYSLVNDYKEDIFNLRGNLSDANLQIHGLDSQMEQCKKDLQTQVKNNNKIFSNLNSCLEREEDIQAQKNKYVIRLSTCRKNLNNLKNKQHKI